MCRRISYVTFTVIPHCATVHYLTSHKKPAGRHWHLSIIQVHRVVVHLARGVPLYGVPCLPGILITLQKILPSDNIKPEDENLLFTGENRAITKTKK